MRYGLTADNYRCDYSKRCTACGARAAVNEWPSDYCEEATAAAHQVALDAVIAEAERQVDEHLARHPEATKARDRLVLFKLSTCHDPSRRLEPHRWEPVEEWRPRMVGL